MAPKEPESERRIEVPAGIGGGRVRGIAVGPSALFLGESIRVSQENAAWRASVESPDSIPGIVTGPRTSFSGAKVNARTCWP
ncbi:hypothetical protein [Streptomyces sp. NPDC047718]|uniref:hypothetical protein n=1 Tax=Streptomyces sp. NPDC047718 TaxID=3155479 RepID=UPI0033D0D84D